MKREVHLAVEEQASKLQSGNFDAAGLVMRWLCMELTSLV
jgi:hypothetical protein